MMTMVDQSIGATDVAELVRRAAEGDREAWERLIDQYSRLIWAITVDFKLPESDAADVVQTTWLRLLEHIDRIEHPDRVGSWLAATARNACLRSLAAQKRVVLGHEDADLERCDEARGLRSMSTSSPASAPRTVKNAVSRLPGRWQRLLELLMADPPTSYIRDLGSTRPSCREHRPHPRALPGRDCVCN